MSDKYLYDKDGNFTGRVSDKPPGDGGAGCVILVVLAVAFLLFLLPGLSFSWFFSITQDAVRLEPAKFQYHTVPEFFDGAGCPETWLVSFLFWSLITAIYFYHKKQKPNV